MSIRKAAVAGSWYPDAIDALGREVDGYLAAAGSVSAEDGQDNSWTDVRAIVAPHAGLRYSGPVAAHAYGVLVGRQYDAVVLVGPSHHVGFRGVALGDWEAFETPLGLVPIAGDWVAAIARAVPSARELPTAHAREHALEMQLPFLQRVLPDTPIVPLVMGFQRRETVVELAEGLATALSGHRVLLVASTDLSHYHDAATAAALDRRVIDHVAAFDAAGLLRTLEAMPDHACGGGPTVAVLQAAWALGARDARVLKYADSGDVSGDKDAVVGYLAAAVGSLA